MEKVFAKGHWWTAPSLFTNTCELACATHQATCRYIIVDELVRKDCAVKGFHIHKEFKDYLVSCS